MKGITRNVGILSVNDCVRFTMEKSRVTLNHYFRLLTAYAYMKANSSKKEQNEKLCSVVKLLYVVPQKLDTACR